MILAVMLLKSMATANNELEIVSPTGNDDGIFENKILTEEEKKILKNLF